MTTSQESVRAWREGATQWIEIDRPHALNAIDFDVMDALTRLLLEVRERDEIRAVVLTGAGDKAFISGGDLKAFAHLRSEEDATMMATRMKQVLALLESLPCWTIACVNADAYGGGCEAMVSCDFRYAARAAKLGWTQARFMLPCGWGGMTRLVELVGRARALEWVATSRVLTATEARDAGLVHDVFEPQALRPRMTRLCDRLTRQPRHLILALKQAALNASRLPRAEAIERELEPFSKCWADDAHLDAVEAFLKKKS